MDYSRYIPTHLREFVNCPGSHLHKRNLGNALGYGWMRLAGRHIEEVISEMASLPKHKFYGPWLHFHKALQGYIPDKVISRICLRFIGGLDLPIEANLEASLASAAIANGCIDVLDYLHSLGERSITNILHMLVSPGILILRNGTGGRKCEKFHPHSVIWLVRHGYPILDNAVHSVAKWGHEQLVNWLMERYPHKAHCGVFPSCLMRGGMMSMVREIDAVAPIVVRKTYVPNAIMGYNVEALQWIFDRVGPESDVWRASDVTGDAYSVAIWYGMDAIVSWLISHNVVMTSRALSAAVRSGNMAMVKRILEHKDRMEFGPTDPKMTDITAASVLLPKLDIAQWLLDQGFKFNSKAFMKAARCGRIGALKWLRINAANLNPEAWSCVRKYAVKGGQIEVLDWLVLNRLI